MRTKTVSILFVAFVCVWGKSQVNSGSNGSDGALDFSSIVNTTNIVINMADHPNGIYQYTYVNIPTNVTLTFTPNANNSPVTWLVQSNVLVNGTIDVSGQSSSGNIGAAGGPGGWAGGSGGSFGQGPGGGLGQIYGQGGEPYDSGGGSYGGLGGGGYAGEPPGPIYGNSFLLPLLGGSGGGSASQPGQAGGGGGGGGAILIAASNLIQLGGQIRALGGGVTLADGGPGSGGAIRLVTALFTGNGVINTAGGAPGGPNYPGGNGRVRIDALESTFGGQFQGCSFSQGFQPIIIQTNGQGIQLAIATVGGQAVSATPTGQFITPDVTVPGQETNPIPVVVSCQNLPLNTPITVTVDPAEAQSVSVIGTNNVGTMASSSATVSLVIPRGGGIIWASALTGN